MRWPHESAITRRDEHLARTRRLSAWVAGGATAASFGLATALGFALPGHAVTSGAQSGQASTGSGSASGQSGQSGASGSGQGTRAGHRHHRLAPPAQAPGNSGAPPVVSSGGS